MLIQVLKSKLNVVVTGASKEYEGSITLDPDLMNAVKLFPYERVEVNARNGKARIVTYVIPGERGSGQVELNGGAANFFKVGHEVHVNCFMFTEWHRWNEQRELGLPRIVDTDENNKVI